MTGNKKANLNLDLSWGGGVGCHRKTVWQRGDSILASGRSISSCALSERIERRSPWRSGR
jgi:hypothetical protein